MAKALVAPGRRWMIFRIVAAAVGISAGLLVGVYFIEKHNWHIVSWGFFSSLWALAAMLLHIFYKQGRLPIYANKLKTVMYLGIFGQFLGLTSFIVYLVLGGVYHDDLSDMSKSYFVASVWSFMTWKWSFVLFWYSRQYRQLMLEEALIPVGGQDTLYANADQGFVANPSEGPFI